MRAKPRASTALLLALGLPLLPCLPFLFWGCGGATPRPEPARNLLLITVDTLRQDKLGAYGHARPTSPALDAFAASACVFDAAQAVSSWTVPAIASILTGQPPATHGATALDVRLGEGWRTLAEALAEQGFVTSAFSAHAMASPRYGFDQGFADFQVHSVLGSTPAAASGEPHAVTTSPWVTERALEWLAGPAPRAGRWFLWLHYFDPHQAYVPHPGISERFGYQDDPRLAEERLYEGEIAYTDGYLGRVLAALDASDLKGSTAVVVVADHGEEFGEHGGTGHKRTLYQEVTRVPLMVRAPGAAPRRVSTAVSQVDLFPTALALLGLPVPVDVAGQNLAPAVHGAAPESRPVLAEIEAEERNPRLHSILAGRWKLIRGPGGSIELFDLERDPGESADVSGKEADIVRALSDQLDARLAGAAAGPRGERAPLDLTPAEASHLRSLGY